MMVTARCLFVLTVVPLWSASFAKNPYSDEETASIQRECIDLGRKYAQYVDNRQPRKVADLFDEHGKFQGVTNSYVGKEDIAIAFGNQPKARRSFHLVSNEVATVQSANLTTVESYYVYYRYEGELKDGFAPMTRPFAMGTYFDECVRTEDSTWLWQLRKVLRRFYSGATS